MPKEKVFNYEKSISQLEKIVGELDSGELSLEKSLELFEEGVGQVKLCQKSLKKAELKIEKLIQTDNKVSTEAFEI